MSYRIYFFLPLLLSLLAERGSAQKFLTWKIFSKSGADTLVSVSIHNITQGRYDLSDEDGSYRIQVMSGDHVAFSSVGYRTDTVTITEEMLLATYPVYLTVKAVTLQSVSVRYNNYQLDSMDRRKEYACVYDNGNTPRVEKQRQGDGVGVEMNIFRRASKGERQRERLQKRLAKEEQDYYVNFRYNKETVIKFTRLQGDSLKQFMKKYRPSYDYCRKAAPVDILVYINDCYKIYMKGE